MNNLVVLRGYLGQDVSLKYTGGGKPVANFSIAVNDGFNENKKTFWFNVVVWEDLALAVSQALKKGSKTTVTGKLVTRKYTDKNDKEVTVTEIVASGVGLPEKKKEDTAAPPVEDDAIPF